MSIPLSSPLSLSSSLSSSFVFSLPAVVIIFRKGEKVNEGKLYPLSFRFSISPLCYFSSFPPFIVFSWFFFSFLVSTFLLCLNMLRFLRYYTMPVVHVALFVSVCPLCELAKIQSMLLRDLRRRSNEFSLTRLKFGLHKLKNLLLFCLLQVCWYLSV